MNNLKNALLGISVAFITFLYWLLIMTYGDEFRRAHADYRNEITLCFVISSLVVNISLIYLFYSRIKLKDKLSLFLISFPFLLVLIIAGFMSQNIPRLLDIVFIAFGTILIYKISDVEMNKRPGLILAAYILMIAVSYPFLYNFLEVTFCKI
ncbi:MAG: hypothetical protein V4580_08155 [Bacteroidota bacterium]